MKLSRPLLLTVSLAANVALFGFAISRSLSSRKTSPDDFSLSPGVIGRPAAAAAGSGLWGRLTADASHVDLAKRLRAAGFPDEVVREIVTTRINQRYAARFAALQPHNTDDNYWTNAGMWGSGISPETRAALRELKKQRQKEIDDALGPRPDTPEHQRELVKKYGSNLSPEKIKAVEAIAQDYNDMSSEIAEAAKGTFLREDREKFALLEQQKRQDLAAVLTPEELENYELRTSQTAMQMRWQLGSFSPSEQEFRTLFDLQSNFAQQHPAPAFTGMVNGNDPAVKEWNDANAALQNQIKAVLGDARYADYQRSQDGNFQQLYNLTNRLDLPKEAANTVYDLSKDIQQRTQQIYMNGNLTADQKNQALAALAEEATDKVTKALGKEGLEDYKESGGWWLNNLNAAQVPRR